MCCFTPPRCACRSGPCQWPRRTPPRRRTHGLQSARATRCSTSPGPRRTTRHTSTRSELFFLPLPCLSSDGSQARRLQIGSSLLLFLLFSPHFSRRRVAVAVTTSTQTSERRLESGSLAMASEKWGADQTARLVASASTVYAFETVK